MIILPSLAGTPFTTLGNAPPLTPHTGGSGNSFMYKSSATLGLLGSTGISIGASVLGVGGEVEIVGVLGNPGIGQQT